MDTKTCFTCGVNKPVSEYYKAKQNKDGLDGKCKPCKLAANKRWAVANPERARAHRRKSSLRYSQVNREAHRERNRQWTKDNPEKNRERVGRRRLLKAANGVFTVTERDLFKLYNSACVVCGSTDSIEADHIIPLARGGRHSIGNLQPLCRSCNASKHDRLMIEWVTRQPRHA